MATINRFFTRALIMLIRAYQWTISPFLGHHCRFFPQCSEYMLEALRTYGILQGLYLGIKRLIRCHPFCKGGVDLLPVEKSSHD
jgi:putative membrane protein insertion efficiency factor